MSFKSITLGLCYISFGLAVLTACETEQSPKTDIITPEIAAPKTVDPVDVAVIPFDTSNSWLTQHVFPKTLEATSLDAAELQLIDSLLANFTAHYNLSEAPKKWEAHKKHYPKDTSSVSGFMFDMKEYKKQCMPVINAKGEKEVWINCFCKSIEKQVEFTDWKTLAVRVIDGGSCFFNLKINLGKKTYSDLQINSEG